MPHFRRLTVLPKIPPAVGRLADIAQDFTWTWEREGDLLFRWLDGELWERLHHNPVAFLLSLNPERLAQAAENPEYLELYNEFTARLDTFRQETSWFERVFPEKKNQVVAYLSAEFGIHECLPIYSGGLGVLAGDYLKAASDVGLPLVGMGLLYKCGYFNQKIRPEGWQEASYPLLNFHEMPVQPIRDSGGREVEVPVDLPGRRVWLKVWEVRLGQVRVYLLDADSPRNHPDDLHLTGSLYGGGHETRLAQELLLGIGGVRALRVLGLAPAVWHINEGHAAFSVVERLRELVQAGVSPETAREVIRASTAFTTHTPISAGHDVFCPEMIHRYCEPLYAQIGLDREGFLRLAYDEERRGFSMTVLALRHAAYCNGVSRLHGQTTRKMFHYLYPNIPSAEIPITSVTNGIHIETWLAREWVEHFTRMAGEGWRTSVADPEAWNRIATLAAAEIWSVRRQLKSKMLEKVRESLRLQRQRYYASLVQQEEVDAYLPLDTLTVVCARRFVTYKRADLLLREYERLARLVNHPEHPVQFIFAGKAHPADHAGQQMIKNLYDAGQDDSFRGKVVFVEDYDMEMAKYLVQGADVWLNIPRRPLEASGTSGMKAALNGAVHLSVLDGWWPEACNGQNGFTVGRGEQYHGEDVQDYYDLRALFVLLEEVVVPAYYQRTLGVPRKWIGVIQEAWRTIPQFFNTGRMIKEYTEHSYVPLMERGASFSAGNYSAAARIAAFKKFLDQNWREVQIQGVRLEHQVRPAAGDLLTVAATVHLGPVSPNDVAVETVVGTARDGTLLEPETVPMQVAETLEQGFYRYTVAMPLVQGALGLTVRVRPVSPDFLFPFEVPLVTWAPEF